MKKITAALFLLFGLLMTAHAENFYIENYDINFNVDSKQNIKIIEDIDVFFTNPSHGIFRKIPAVNNVIRSNGKSSKTFANISKVSVSENYTTERQNNDYIIKIGDPNTLVEGKHSYKISYDYDLEAENNEFYFNIIGTGWDTTIEKVRFQIYMPKNFPYDKVGLSIGAKGTEGFKERAVFEVVPELNLIKGYTTKKLMPNEGITIRIKLPEDYFISKNKSARQRALCLFLIILFTFISFIYWYAYGKDYKAIPVVNFYPPKGYDSAVLGVLYKGEATIKEVVSLIVYLADKGYIRIIDDKYSFKLEKIKQYEGKSKILKRFINALFPINKKEVRSTELKASSHFYKECTNIIKDLDKIKKHIYEEDSISLKTKMPVILSVIGLLLALLCVLSDFGIDCDIITGFVGALPFVVTSIFVLKDGMRESQNILSKIFCGILAFFLGIPPLVVAVYSSANAWGKYPIISTIGFVALIISAICLYHLPKRTEGNVKILGQILGFKKFIETAEISRIKELVKENPQYCFNILPYAYVLNISQDWIKKFETIIDTKPDWYIGDFNHTHFDNFTNKFTQVSTPSVSNGGISHSSSSGGGGFSGGDSGGGGGGSW